MNITTASLVAATVIGFITVYIALQQWLTNKNQLRLHLFDKRWEVYEAAMKLAQVIAAKGDNIAVEDVHEFEVATQSVFFLFDEEIQDYCEKLRNEAFAVIAGTKIIETLQGAQHTESAISAGERMKWFADQWKEIPKRFAPFLRAICMALPKMKTIRYLLCGAFAWHAAAYGALNAFALVWSTPPDQTIFGFISFAPPFFIHVALPWALGAGAWNVRRSRQDPKWRPPFWKQY